ncbi:hypothetical protein LAZ67_2006926 [Cordylochernes scorpioides]|uniref:Uncharacterized protein n=1 Tax=Cordylochernes scorpioides TaxID=51811 RepID=A0ABY6K797_9ARAC|nr:hypothetical protein LAZ67_2006926 [Cordylochernes scorpioides]
MPETQHFRQHAASTYVHHQPNTERYVQETQHLRQHAASIYVQHQPNTELYVQETQHLRQQAASTYIQHQTTCNINLILSAMYRKPNIFDNMLVMMEKYANNLEALVDERTSMLIEEKKKTEELLYEMLPRSIVNRFPHRER